MPGNRVVVGSHAGAFGARRAVVACVPSPGPFAVPMGASVSKPAEVKPKKICCACPITKLARDACLPENGEEKCRYLIEAHLRCLRDEGFEV